MDGHCAGCGYAKKDYLGRYDRKWLTSVLAIRLELCFSGLPERSLPRFGDYEEIAVLIAEAAEKEDLHEAVHLSQAVASASAALALGEGYLEEGLVAQLNVSPGGVPKLPVDTTEISYRGLEGDRHREPKHHGHAWQALCLWSSEVIDALATEGHPIMPGGCGENVTLRGLDWAKLRSGLLLSLGPEVLVEVSLPATPCAKNRRWFTRGDIGQMDYDLHPSRTRWYASVLRGGTLRASESAMAFVSDSLSPSAGLPSSALTDG